MAKPLVVCRCDPKWLAIACCDVCEARDREVVLERRRVEHVSSAAWNALVASYFDDDPRLDSLDLADRARDAADAWRMGPA